MSLQNLQMLLRDFYKNKVDLILLGGVRSQQEIFKCTNYADIVLKTYCQQKADVLYPIELIGPPSISSKSIFFKNFAFVTVWDFGIEIP